MIELVTATDAGYVPWVAAMAGSVARRQREPAGVRLTVLHDGIDAAAQERIRRDAGELGTSFVPVGPDDYRALGLPTDPLVLTPHYFRLLAPQLLAPARLLYLDADVLVLDDLAALWSQPLGDAPLGAVPDPLRRVGRMIADHAALGLDPGATYVNTGVLLFDCERWRTEPLARRILERSIQDREQLTSSGVQQYEQYAVNVELCGRIALLPRRWNYPTTRVPLGRPAVAHYLGTGKPGRKGCWPGWARRFEDEVGLARMAPWAPPADERSSVPAWARSHLGWRADQVLRGRRGRRR